VSALRLSWKSREKQAVFRYVSKKVKAHKMCQLNCASHGVTKSLSPTSILNLEVISISNIVIASMMMPPPPNALLLHNVVQETHDHFPAETVSIAATDILTCFDHCLSPDAHTMTINCSHEHLGFIICHDDAQDRGFIYAILPKSTAALIPSYKRHYIGAYFLCMNDTPLCNTLMQSMQP
jgi:hypothetical protein